MVKKALNMLIKGVKMDKKVQKINRIMNFQACRYKSQHVAQNKIFFALSHDGETMTFRNSALVSHVRNSGCGCGSGLVDFLLKVFSQNS